jgi:hypothetical protein
MWWKSEAAIQALQNRKPTSSSFSFSSPPMSHSTKPEPEPEPEPPYFSSRNFIQETENKSSKVPLTQKQQQAISDFEMFSQFRSKVPLVPKSSVPTVHSRISTKQVVAGVFGTIANQVSGIERCLENRKYTSHRINEIHKTLNT